MKKTLLFSILSVFLASTVFALPAVSYNTKKAIVDNKAPKEISDISSVDLVKQMKTGWNLGNTLDATGGTGLASETSWSQPHTEQIMLEFLEMSGMKTIRLPVTWSNHLIDSKYTIDPDWMNRVKEIVDWAIDLDMYVIINSHHDNWYSPKKMPKCKGYYPNSLNYEESERFLTNIWTQIATAFNNGYDEHLLFETMNEPRLAGTNYEWWNPLNTKDYEDAAESLNKLNQCALDSIRKTGGNNAKRCVIVPGLRAAVDSALESKFKLPTDTIENKLMISVHMYSPYKFAMEAPGVKRFVDAHKMELESYFKNLNETYVQNGVGVFVGEYGATNKDNDEYRVLWLESFLSLAKKYNAVCCLWDNGVDSPDPNNTEHFGYYNRRAGMWFNEDFIDKINEVYEE